MGRLVCDLEKFMNEEAMARVGPQRPPSPLPPEKSADTFKMATFANVLL